MEKPAWDGETCETCRFHAVFASCIKGSPVGECRRRSPVSVEENWPTTRTADWCGDWVRGDDDG